MAQKKNSKSLNRTARVLFSQGMDRSSTELMLESSYEAVSMFPVVQTPVVMAMNVNDDILGGLSKRGGGSVFMDNPDNNGVGLLKQYITPQGNAYTVRQSGTNLYVVPISSGSYSSGISLTLSTSSRMRAVNVAGLCFLTNGTDPFMFTDGARFYNLVNSCVIAITTSSLDNTYGPVVGYGPQKAQYTYNADGTINTTYVQGNPIYGTLTINVSPISFNSSNGNNFYPNYGFLANGNEIISYSGTTLDGSNRIIAFTGCTRGYADTTPQSLGSGGTLSVTYGTPPTTPLYVEFFLGRLMAANTPSLHSSIQDTANRGEITDAINFIIDLADPVKQAVSSNQANTKVSDGDQITGIIENNDRMLTFKSSHVYMGNPDNYGNLQSFNTIDRDYGTFSNESIASIQSTAFYINQIGVFGFNGQDPILMSKSIDDLTKSISQINLTQTCSIGYDYKLFISVGSVTAADRFGGGTYSNVVLVYNYLTSAWFLYQYPFTINCFAKMKDSTGKVQLYYGDTAGNTYMYTPNTYVDGASSAIGCWIESKYMFFQQPSYEKVFNSITPLSEGGENAKIAFSYMRDNIRTDYTDSMQLPEYMAKYNFPDVDNTPYAISARVSEISTSAFIFNGFEIEYTGIPM